MNTQDADRKILRRLIEQASSSDDLVVLWQQHRDLWTDIHTSAARVRKQQIEAAP